MSGTCWTGAYDVKTVDGKKLWNSVNITRGDGGRIIIGSLPEDGLTPEQWARVIGVLAMALRDWDINPSFYADHVILPCDDVTPEAT
jgi:hypothetical protein